MAVGVVGLLVAVLFSDGFRARTYDLEDAYVWVTGASDLRRLNYSTQQQDWSYKSLADPDGLAGSVDVVQDGTDVFLSHDSDWFAVDPVNLVLDKLQWSGARVAAGGGRVGLLDSSGGVWVASTEEAASLGADQAAPGEQGEDEAAETESDRDTTDESTDEEGSTGEAEPDENASAFEAGVEARLAVGRSGDVAVLTGDRTKLVTIGTGADSEPLVVDIDGELPTGGDAEVSLVGRRAVALVGDTLVLPNGSTQRIDGSSGQTDGQTSGVALQLAGDRSDWVIVATGASLVAVPLAGGEPSTLSGTDGFVAADGGGEGETGSAAPERLGTPTRPVHVAGITAAAWSGAGGYLYWGAEGDRTVRQNRDDLNAAQLRFRVNRRNVALNDAATGTTWVVVDGEVISSQFDNAQPTTTSTTIDPDNSEQKTLSFDPATNEPPTAENDFYGARPALPTIIRPLDNDSDPDSDVLTIELDADTIPEGLEVDLVEGAQALQITPRTATAGDTAKFSYRASDGNPDPDKRYSNYAEVEITAHGADTNSPPELKPGRSQEFSVGIDSSADYPVLQDWWDPEGDPIHLAGASVPDLGLAQVAAQSNGKLTYTDLGGAPTTTEVTVTVADAPILPGVKPLEENGAIAVTVTRSGVPPQVRNDYATALEKEPVIVRPLANDTDADGDSLSLSTLVGTEYLPPGATATPNPDGTVTVVSDAPGPLTFGYEVAGGGNLDGGTVPTGRIRVDVLAREAERVAPTAGLDLVVLPELDENGTAERTVDLLANDYSPSGDVLVASNLSPLESGDEGRIQRQLLELRRLRVSAKGPMPDPITFNYTLSDGTATDVDGGTVVVVTSPSSGDLPPVTADDTVNVRSGDVVSVPVLGNDIDPEGARLYLGPEVEPSGDTGGTAWAAGARVRFVAPEVPRNQTEQYVFTYTAYDGPGPDFSGANPAIGKLTVTVTNPEAQNRPPKPLPVEARVLAGKRVKITVPTSGIDPDGDSVSLVGIGENQGEPHAPSKGRVIDVGIDTIIYEALPDSRGTDTFSYTVSDGGGITGGEPRAASGVIRVGIAEGTENGEPQAMDDRYQVPPGTSFVVDPLDNDVDPDGDTISLLPEDPFAGYAGNADVAPEKSKSGIGRLVRIEVPSSGPVDPITYQIQDPAGATGRARIYVEVVNDAAGRPPVARDDRVDVVDENGKPITDDFVTVPVLDNDTDPDGDPDKLTLEPLTASSDVVPASGEVKAQLQVPLIDRPQVIPYRIVDEQGLPGYAVVRVPSAGSEVDEPPTWTAANDCAVEIRPLAPKATVAETELGIELRGDAEPTPFDLRDCGITDPEGTDVRIPTEGSIVSTDARLSAVVGDGGTSFTLSDRDAGKGAYPAVVSMVVVDTDEHPTSAVVQIPVRVVPGDPDDPETNLPPEWKQAQRIAVTMDGEPSNPTVDLSELVDDNEGDELAFEVVATSHDAIDPRLDGSLLDVRGSDELTEGGDYSATLRVTDGIDGHADDQEFPLDVTLTNKPEPTLRQLATIEATLDRQGKADVLKGHQDPFGEGLTLQPNPTATEGQGDVSVSSDGQSILFTPSRVGDATVAFEARDGLGRPAFGRVTFKVVDRPDAPGPPTPVGFTHNSVTLKWGVPDDNGEPIDDYRITSVPGGVTQNCGTKPACEITGLTAGTEYRFTVAAHNDTSNNGGWSDESPPSAPQVPNVCPAAPTNVVLAFDSDSNPATGGQLVASWNPADTRGGTPVLGYEIKVNPGGATVSAGAGETSKPIPGLTNGVEHDVAIHATHACDGGKGAEAISNPEVPAGEPDAPTDVQAARFRDKVGGKIDLSWVPPTAGGSPSDNGDPVASYTITETSGKTAPVTIDASAAGSAGSGRLQYRMAVDEGVAGYSFVVTATNKAGEGAGSAATTPVNASGIPDAVTGLTSTPSAGNGVTGLNGELQLAFTAPQDTHGPFPVSGYQYRVDGGQWTDLAGDRRIRGLNNGKAYRVEVRAITQDEQGDPAAIGPSDSTKPYGPVLEPNVSSVRVNPQRVEFRWRPPSPANTGRPVTVRYKVNSEGWTNVGESGDIQRGNDYEQTFTITVQRCDSMGQCAERQDTRSTAPRPPPPEINIWWGGVGTSTIGSCNSPSQGCRWIHGNVMNFPANSTVGLSCRDNDGQYWSFSVRTNGSGAAAFPATGTCLYGQRGWETWLVSGGTVSNRIRA